MTYSDVLIAGCEYVEVQSLPAGPGVLPAEVGQPGPWFGIRWPDGTVRGWARDKVQLDSLLDDEPWRAHARKWHEIAQQKLW